MKQKVKCTDYSKEICSNTLEEKYSSSFGKYLTGCGYAKGNGVVELDTTPRLDILKEYHGYCPYRNMKVGRRVCSFENLMKDILNDDRRVETTVR